MSAKKQNTPRKVIACTCRIANHSWIQDRRLYNLPLPKDGTGESYASVANSVKYTASDGCRYSWEIFKVD